MFVRTTEKCLDQVKDKIRAMFAERINHATNWGNYGMNIAELEQLIWRSVVSPEDEKLLETVPSKFLNHRKDMRVKLPDDELYCLNFDSPRAVPLNSDSYYNPPNSVYYCDELKAIVKARKEACDRVEKEQNEFINKVTDVWNKCSSVNEVLKLWPGVRDLLPPEVIQRVEAKPAKREKKTIDQINVADLNVQLLKARVAA